MKLGLAIFSIALGTIALTGCKSAPQPSAPAQSVQQQPFAAEGSSQPRRHSNNAAGASVHPGDFDFYLLNLSWSPEFCFHHRDSPQCPARPGFVVHGLWPQNGDGTYPEHCSDAPGPADPSADTDLQPTASLVEHEWQAHGTCSGLSADAYFALIRRARAKVRIPAAFSRPTQPRSEIPDAILDQFTQINTGFPRESFALSCGNNYLTAIEVCFEKNLNPVGCENVPSCRANSIRITPR
jgi:ribonuclease T2